jgi:2-hydroxychromene-2-carboxylate isomerase
VERSVAVERGVILGGRVEFLYDLVSPFSYLAYGRLGEVCDRHDAELVLHPVLLGALHDAAGIQAPVSIPAKGRYMNQDLQRWAEEYGLTMHFPEPFPFRTLKTMRAAIFCRGRGELETFTREAFKLYWEENGAPGGREEYDEDGPISEVARRIGADPEEVLAGAAEPEVKEELKDATSDALDRGAFGAPTFFVGDEMFWGNDRLEFVERELERAG